MSKNRGHQTVTYTPLSIAVRHEWNWPFQPTPRPTIQYQSTHWVLAIHRHKKSLPSRPCNSNKRKEYCDAVFPAKQEATRDIQRRGLLPCPAGPTWSVDCRGSRVNWIRNFGSSRRASCRQGCPFRLPGLDCILAGVFWKGNVGGCKWWNGIGGEK